MDWCDLTKLRWDGYVCVAEESNGPLDEMLTIRILQRHPPMFFNVIHKWEFLQTLPTQTIPSVEFLGWDGGTLNRRVGQNLTQKNYTTNTTQRPLCDPFITISFAHKAKRSGENWQNGHLLKKNQYWVLWKWVAGKSVMGTSVICVLLGANNVPVYG